MLETIAVATAVIGTAAAAYEDWRTTYIPDELNYAMIAIGAILLFLAFPLETAAWHLLAAGIVFTACLALYLFGQLGGGDVKLFTALALLLPQHPSLFQATTLNPVVAPYPFIVSVFFAAAVLSMVFIPIIYLRRLFRDRRKIKDFNKKIAVGFGFCIALSPLLYLWSTFSLKSLVIAPALILGAFTLSFKNDIMKKYVVMKKAVKDLTDDDVLAIDQMDEKTRKRLGLSMRKTFFTSELKQIKKRAARHKIKKILVAEHLPQFGPFILASLLMNLALGDAFLWLLMT